MEPSTQAGRQAVFPGLWQMEQPQEQPSDTAREANPDKFEEDKPLAMH